MLEEEEKKKKPINVIADCDDFQTFMLYVF